MTVDSAFAERLKADALYVSATPSGAPAWTDRAVESQIVTPLATLAGASAEAQRQADFLGGPLVKDTHIVPGARRDLLAKPVTISIGKLGYDAGVPCFVIGVVEQPNNTSALTVLRKLA